MYCAKVKIANKKQPNTSTTIKRTNSEFLTRELALGKVCPFKSYLSQCPLSYTDIWFSTRTTATTKTNKQKKNPWNI